MIIKDKTNLKDKIVDLKMKIKENPLDFMKRRTISLVKITRKEVKIIKIS